MTFTAEDCACVLQAHEQGQTIPCRHCGGVPNVGLVASCQHCHGIGADFCEIGHCPLCEGMDHHWMPDCDEYSGEPRMACKHCDAIREYVEADE